METPLTWRNTQKKSSGTQCTEDITPPKLDKQQSGLVAQRETRSQTCACAAPITRASRTREGRQSATTTMAGVYSGRLATCMDYVLDGFVGEDSIHVYRDDAGAFGAVTQRGDPPSAEEVLPAAFEAMRANIPPGEDTLYSIGVLPTTGKPIPDHMHQSLMLRSWDEMRKNKKRLVVTIKGKRNKNLYFSLATGLWYDGNGVVQGQAVYNKVLELMNPSFSVITPGPQQRLVPFSIRTMVENRALILVRARALCPRPRAHAVGWFLGRVAF